ncbi:glycosyltransferase involved in cell wall biosynthesis [Luteibacter sp. Sphag1AF]|uniref:glycosyltransferase n=1 Tax=Luteibacter sp. Sphag1AF TaxID=2587031 RepID=UPI0016227219|nr:glycosyltransferase [Luteibacter sp. Sphag1AF]MBB3225430.1 glycosyltransferase involved in cell wall biosynthesis [Luteibacter sp. Sphag1AF]
MSGASRPHLVIVSSTFPRWAGDHEPGFVHEYARHLLPFYRVTVLCPRAPGAASRETMDGVDVHRFGYAPRSLETLVNEGGIANNLKRFRWKLLLLPTFFLGGILALRRIVARERIEAIHAHWFIPGGVIAALGAGRVPFMLTAHGSDVHGLRGKWMLRLKRWVAGRAARLAAVSEPLAKALERDLGDGHAVDVLPMGTDLTRFRPSGVADRDPGMILFVGRLVPIKGCDVLLRAFARVANTHPEARLVLAGSGPERERLGQLACALGITARVDFLGGLAQTELPTLYRRAGMLVWPSLLMPDGEQEGLGLVVPEAAACGCGVILSAQPAMRWLLGDTSEVFVAPGDVDALAAAMRRRLDDPRSFDTVDRAVTALVTARLDWNSVAAGYAQRLHAMAAGQGGSD